MGTSTCVFPQVMGFLDGKLNVNNWQYLSGARRQDYTQCTCVLSRVIVTGTPLSVFSAETVTWLASKFADA